jgi:hypothetical protein
MRWAPAIICAAALAAGAPATGALAQATRLPSSIVTATRPLTPDESRALGQFLDQNLIKLASPEQDAIRAGRADLIRALSQSTATPLFRSECAKVLIPRLNEIVESKDLLSATNALEVMRSICTSDAVLALCKAADPDSQKSAALRLVAASGIPSSIARTTLNDAQASIVVRAMRQSIQSESNWMAATYDFQALFALATSKTVPAPVQKEARKAQVDAIKSLADRVSRGGDDAALVHALWRSLGVVLQQQVALTPAGELNAMNKGLSPVLGKIASMGDAPPKGAGASDSDFREVAAIADNLRTILGRSSSRPRGR